MPSTEYCQTTTRSRAGMLHRAVASTALAVIVGWLPGIATAARASSSIPGNCEHEFRGHEIGDHGGSCPGDAPPVVTPPVVTPPVVTPPVLFI